MRLIFAFVVCVIAGSTFDTARADPYRYCAVMGGGQEGGMVSCYFMTLQQCQATISGIRSIWTSPSAAVNSLMRKLRPWTSCEGLP